MQIGEITLCQCHGEGRRFLQVFFTVRELTAATNAFSRILQGSISTNLAVSNVDSPAMDF